MAKLNFQHTSTPVTILGAANHGPLCIVRSLGRLSIPVFAIDPAQSTPAYHSRYCRGRFVSDLDGAFNERSVLQLLQIGRNIGRSILIPTTDEAAIFVADHAPALKEAFLFPDQSAELVRSLCSKKQMYFLA